MALYQPMNGWDGNILVAASGDTAFVDASEVFDVQFDEKFNLERRKQLGTHSPPYMPGRYEASGKASGYFITGGMATKLYGSDGSDTQRDHAARPVIQFNIRIDFSDYPIQVRAAAGSVGQITLVGYVLSGCLIDSDSFSLKEGVYVEKPFSFMIQNIYDIYDSDTDSDLIPFIV